MRILGFDWDETNRRKLEMHELYTDYIEELLADTTTVVFQHPSRRGRFLALGFGPDGRFVLVAFEHDREIRWVGVVTAYEPTNSRWWREYTRLRAKLD